MLKKLFYLLPVFVGKRVTAIFHFYGLGMKQTAEKEDREEK
jgi:hypothetical protein